MDMQHLRAKAPHQISFRAQSEALRHQHIEGMEHIESCLSLLLMHSGLTYLLLSE